MEVLGGIIQVLQRAGKQEHGASGGHGMLCQHLPQRCHLHSHGPGPLCASVFHPFRIHSQQPRCTASSTLLALGSLQDEGFAQVRCYPAVSGSGWTMVGTSKLTPPPCYLPCCSSALSAHRSWCSSSGSAGTCCGWKSSYRMDICFAAGIFPSA